MSDPLTDLVGLLRPRTVLWKRIDAAGEWSVGFTAARGVKFGVLTRGNCLLLADGPPLRLNAGDFLLLCGPAPFRFASGPDVRPVEGEALLAEVSDNVIRLGSNTDDPVRLIGGAFLLEPADHDLLHHLVPDRIHLPGTADGTARIARLLDLIGDEATADRPGAAFVLPRLVEVMLVEALRSERVTPPRGMLRALRDPNLGAALLAFHADVRHPWTVAELATAAHLSRTVFAARFAEQVGTTPVAYVLAWRMALAKDALTHSDQTIEEIARTVGYGSASAFSNAFHRFTGSRPGRDRRLLHAAGEAAGESATSMVNRHATPNAGWMPSRRS
ncbi:AraC family transcriptional regulator [Streptomyces diastaticus]|uniref:AraC family transcriptional regulator n=1 Tax=Streptomyces diastaticus TaxID=1956 RepID=UPI00365461A8